MAATLLALVGMLLLASSASAKDRNHDRIPDRWEKRHSLSLKVNQARKDQDRDGLKNRAEWKAGTSPRDDDSDNDGIEDGTENAGTILSFDGSVLKITVFGQSDPLVGLVDSSTEIECEHSGATLSEHGDDTQGSGDDTQGSDDGGPGDDQGDDQSDGQNGDGQHGDDDQFDEQPCGTDQLTAGMKVKEAELELHSGSAVFHKLELHP
jgi:hypothetical protein